MIYTVQHNSTINSFIMTTKIADLWKKSRDEMFNSDESSDTGITTEYVEKMTKMLDGTVTKIGAFGLQIDTVEDFNLLEKPIEDFIKSYVVFIGTLQ